MSTTCKSPRKIAQMALGVGKDALKRYSHRFSPKTFTQPQLFACLVLKQFYKTDYRGIVAILEDNSDLRRTLGLSRVPHFTTIEKAAKRLLRNAPVQALLDQTLQHARPRRERAGGQNRAEIVFDLRLGDPRGPSAVGVYPGTYVGEGSALEDRLSRRLVKLPVREAIDFFSMLLRRFSRGVPHEH